MNKNRILIIEDTKSILEEIKVILTLEGFEVATAENGVDGIRAAKKTVPDLIICDVLMPIKNGFEVYEELYRHSDTRQIPFIFLTAKSAPEDIRQGMNLGAEDYITKPFDVDVLLNSINRRLLKAEENRKFQAGKIETLQSNISRAIPHELLTPLNGIIGFSHLLKDSEQSTPEEIREFSTYIYESGQRLLKTIKKFIYYTEVELYLGNDEKGKLLKNESIEVGGPYCNAECNQIGEKYNRLDDLKLQWERAQIRFPENYFLIVVSEILDNAFKFSSKGQMVTLKVEKREDKFIISISDHGNGISESNIANLSAFNQFDRKKLEQQGLGMGLITVKKLMQFFGGELNISARHEGGTRVDLVFLLA